MKENSIEEDIKILEKNVESVKENSDMAFFETDEDYYFFKAVDHILSDYKRVLKENETLKAFTKSISIFDGDIEKEVIPVKKVKDKIEELNEYYKKEIYPTRFNWVNVNITEYYDGMIELLQELIEENGGKRC